MFDTDAENADATTITNFSNDSTQDRLRQQGAYVQDDYQNEEDQDKHIGDDSHYAGDEESGDDMPHHLTYGDRAVLSHAIQQTNENYIRSPSYPETTQPDEDEGNFGDHDQSTYEPENAQNHMHAPWTTPQDHVRASIYASQDPYTVMRSKDAASRENLRPDRNLPLRNGATRNGLTRPLATKPAQSPQRRQSHHIQTIPSAQAQPREQRPARNPPRHSPAVSNAETINAGNSFGRAPAAQQVPLTPSEASSDLPLDYDEQDLRRMDYTQLDNEPFDHAPRVESSELPLADRAHSPIEDRLASAYRDLRPGDQARFFASLKMDEWEEAGDWFLTQFGDLVGKFRDARKKKRSVARGFEDEIKQRSDDVGRKRRCVEEEIGNMKNKGQNLLPQTPSRRRAGTPAFTPR
ncbi:hypothetical protein SLS56_001348 [Neofusicoccum ribis]|uniref:Extracellular mutant protein 11 C-terminal domain-containing protein n=1 Tax=Neofusicoccum ribis TaxID=45134 RepID=A0ABR3T9G1_9PEZI